MSFVEVRAQEGLDSLEDGRYVRRCVSSGRRVCSQSVLCSGQRSAGRHIVSGESTYVGVEVRCVYVGVYVGLFSVCVSGQRSAVETYRVSRESTYVEAEPGRVYRFVLVSGKHEDAPRTHAHQGSSNDAPARVGVVCEFHYVV